jgi:hypothetical protein
LHEAADLAGGRKRLRCTDRGDRRQAMPTALRMLRVTVGFSSQERARD